MADSRTLRLGNLARTASTSLISSAKVLLNLIRRSIISNVRGWQLIICNDTLPRYEGFYCTLNPVSLGGGGSCPPPCPIARYGHAHTHMHACMHTCTHTCTRTHAHMHIHTHIHIHNNKLSQPYCSTVPESVVEVVGFLKQYGAEPDQEPLRRHLLVLSPPTSS